MTPKHERRVLCVAARGALDEWLSRLEHDEQNPQLCLAIDFGELAIEIVGSVAVGVGVPVSSAAKKPKSTAARAVRKLLEVAHGDGEHDIKANGDDHTEPDLDEARSGQDGEGPEDDRVGRGLGLGDEESPALRSREAWAGLSGMGLTAEKLLSIVSTRDTVLADLGTEEYALRVGPISAEIDRQARALDIDVVAFGYAAASRAEDDPALAMLYSCALADILEERALDMRADDVLAAALDGLSAEAA